MTRSPGPLLRSFLPVLAYLIVTATCPASAQENAEADLAEYEGIHIDPSRELVSQYIILKSDLVTINTFNYSEELLDQPPIPEVLGSATGSIHVSPDMIQDIYSFLPPEEGTTGLGGYIAYAVEDGRFTLRFAQGLPLWVAITTGVGLISLGGIGVAGTMLLRERRRRKHEAAVRQRALYAREAERARIAREIHDGPLQDVHALRLLTGDPDRETVDAEAARISRELRAIAEGLRPPALGRFGLAAALSAHTNRVRDRYPDVSVQLDLDEDRTGRNALPDFIRSALFRIIQESITNAIEHGEADRVRVRFKLPEEPGGSILIEIADNGSGFPWTGPTPDFAALADGGHYGLVGIHERAEAVGGTLDLIPTGIDGRGATVRVIVPDVRERDASSKVPRRLLPA